MASFYLVRPPSALRNFSVPASSNGSPLSPQSKGPVIMEIPLDRIRRPLLRTRANDQQKVQQLMDSISEIGLQVPIDVLEVDGVYYGLILIANNESCTVTTYNHEDNHMLMLCDLLQIQTCRFLRLSSLRGSSAARASHDPLQDPEGHKRDPKASPAVIRLASARNLQDDSYRLGHALV